MRQHLFFIAVVFLGSFFLASGLPATTVAAQPNQGGPGSAAPAFSFGNAARTLDVRSPGTKNWDFSIIKDTALVEGLRTQFRIEAINAFNRPVFSAPNTTVGSAAFGQISSQANFPRVVQLSVRLLF